jgi:hypothetical protein
MIVDMPDLENRDRLLLAASAVERGEHVLVWVQKRGLRFEHCYRNWVTAMLRDRGHSHEDASILACGVEVFFEEE